MEWYSARKLYEFVHEEDDRPPEADALWEEKLFVFSCDEDDDFDEKLAALGKEEEGEYENALGKRVAYTFREVLEVQEIMAESVGDGTEVFYRFWDNPGERDFEEMRQTQTEAWWKADEDQDEQRAKQQS